MVHHVTFAPRGLRPSGPIERGELGSTLLRLPMELLDHVASYADDAELLALARTSHVWRQLVAPRLTLTAPTPPPPPSVGRNAAMDVLRDPMLKGDHAVHIMAFNWTSRLHIARIASMQDHLSNYDRTCGATCPSPQDILWGPSQQNQVAWLFAATEARAWRTALFFASGDRASAHAMLPLMRTSDALDDLDFFSRAIGDTSSPEIADVVCKMLPPDAAMRHEIFCEVMMRADICRLFADGLPAWGRNLMNFQDFDLTFLRLLSGASNPEASILAYLNLPYVKSCLQHDIADDLNDEGVRILRAMMYHKTLSSDALRLILQTLWDEADMAYPLATFVDEVRTIDGAHKRNTSFRTKLRVLNEHVSVLYARAAAMHEMDD